MSQAASHADLEKTIEAAWEDRANVSTATTGAVREAVEEALNLLDSGKARVAEKAGESWQVNQWLKKAVLLSFRLNDMVPIEGGPGSSPWWDKVPSKFSGWGEAEFRSAGFRAVPGCFVRRGSYIAPGAVLMPSFINLGAHVGEGTMVDTWVTIGSCARSARTVTSRAAPASPACWSRSRPTRSSSRTIASSAPAPRWPRA